MKKNFDYWVHCDPTLKKLIIRLKIALLLIVAGVSSVLAAPGYAQLARVSLGMKSAPLEKVLDEIESQSEFYFIFNQKQIDVNRVVDIKQENKLITDILPELFKGTNVQYALLDRKILLTIDQPENEMKTSKSDAEFQQQTISGTINEASTKQPMPGVNIVIKGTAIGAISDVNGEFTLQVPDLGNTILVISFIGYKTSEIPVAGKSVIDVALEAEVTGLDEVVVIGYGTQQKATLTGAVSTVAEAKFRLSTAPNAASRLQGRVAGVTVTNENSPGGETTVRIRGYGSVNNNNPLYVVDGIPITGGLNQINPNDIESMTVLKDASSSAIYGARAANGVIIVTTKRGKSGLTVDFTARAGIQHATNQLNMANTQEYADITWLEFKNAGLKVGDNGWGSQQYGYGATPIIPDYIIPSGKMEGEVDESTYSYPTPYKGITKANKSGTNWYDEIFDPALFQEYNLSVSGGSDKSKYSISMGYTDQKGAVIHTGFERYSGRANVEGKITDWLEIGQTLGIAMTNRVSFTDNSADNPVSMAYRMQPIVPVYDIRGNFAGTQAATTGDGENPVAVLFRNKDNISKQSRVLGSGYIQATITKDLVFKTLVGLDYITIRENYRNLPNPEGIKANLINSLTESYNGSVQLNWTNTLNYNRTFNGIHKFNILIGSELVNYKNDYFSGGRSQFAFTDLDYMVLNAGETNQVSSGSFDEWRTLSFFGRLNYSFKDKYLFEAVFREDGSSRFDSSSRWGSFPAASAGWVLSKESFMSGVKLINALKLRAGWGMNGNDNVGNYNSYSTFRSAGNASYYNIIGASSTTSQAGFYKYRLGNPQGKWEATETINIGVDLAMFKSRFEVNIDFYNRTTNDMLYPDSRPDTWGALTLPSVNIGEMKNTGYDLILTYRSKPENNFRYSISANITQYKNEVVKLNNNPDEVRYGDDLRGERYTITKQGYPVSSLFGYVVEGIFNTWDEVNAHPKYNPSITGVDTYSQPGAFKYKDVNEDGIISPNDRTIIGSPHPKFSYGINFDLSYKNWDLTMFVQGVQGNDLVNYVSRWIDFQQFQGGRSSRRLYESWTTERYESGAKITMPLALANDSPLQKPSSFFVEDGSYLRMKNLQIGYTLPSQVASKLGIKVFRIYLQSDNLFTITNYTGLDAENRARIDNNLGVDQGVYPTMQMILCGVNLSF